MKAEQPYIFTSARLGFRNWVLADIDKMYEINSDELVMEFFPRCPTKQQTIDFIERMKAEYVNTGFCYFAVDILDDNTFIGFIGICKQTFEADFTPCIDIGWRLSRSAWNKGFATEGAKRCLEYAKYDLKLEEIFAIAPKVNTKSERVMMKIGMSKLYEFEHPLLLNDERLRVCVLYRFN